MATTDHDFYELLGVPRDADDAAIKKAFRRLARELHPDVSDAPDAEARFREVTEAYEVLSNSETRAVYDRFGHAGLRSGGFQPTNFDLGNLGDLFSAFFGDDLFGGRPRVASRAVPTSARRSRSSSSRRRAARRSRCRSRSPSRAARAAVTASSPAPRHRRCPRCDGTGRLQQVTRSPLGQFVRTHACPQCARPRRDRRAPVSHLHRRGCRRRGAADRGRRPGGHPRRSAHPALG